MIILACVLTYLVLLGLALWTTTLFFRCMPITPFVVCLFLPHIALLTSLVTLTLGSINSTRGQTILWRIKDK